MVEGQNKNGKAFSLPKTLRTKKKIKIDGGISPTTLMSPAGDSAAAA
jgi:hypothetical protein